MDLKVLYLSCLVNIFGPVDKWSKSSPFHGGVRSSNLLGVIKIIINNGTTRRVSGLILPRKYARMKFLKHSHYLLYDILVSSTNGLGQQPLKLRMVSSNLPEITSFDYKRKKVITFEILNRVCPCSVYKCIGMGRKLY